jgi:type IV pilus assembly protein PilA
MVADTLVVDRWAYTEFPERQKRELSGCLIAFLIGFFVAIPMIAILAAIAISQYQDYVIRSQVSEGSSLADGMKMTVAEYYQNHGSFPSTNSAAGLAAAESISGLYVSSVDAAGGTLVARYSNRFPQKANQMLDGKTLIFKPEAQPGAIEWHCSSPDLKQKWCSSRCDCNG